MPPSLLTMMVTGALFVAWGVVALATLQDDSEPGGAGCTTWLVTAALLAAFVAATIWTINDFAAML